MPLKIVNSNLKHLHKKSQMYACDIFDKDCEYCYSVFYIVYVCCFINRFTLKLHKNVRITQLNFKYLTNTQ